MERLAGVEPATCRSAVGCSSAELQPLSRPVRDSDTQPSELETDALPLRQRVFVVASTPRPANINAVVAVGVVLVVSLYTVL